MGSGKTVYLIRYIETHGRHSPVLFINNKKDNRDGDEAPWSSRSILTSSAHADKLNATYLKVEKLADVKDDEVKKHSMVIIDESQFFEDLVEGVLRFSETLGKDVVAAGLLTDFKRRPFGHLLEVIGLADKHYHLDDSLCEDCLAMGIKRPSLFTRRLTESTEQVVIGKDQYRGVCRECWIKGN